jgi:hypothetical protein
MVLALLGSAAMLLPLYARRRLARAVAASQTVGRRFVLVRPTSFVKLALINLAACVLNLAVARNALIDLIRGVYRGLGVGFMTGFIELLALVFLLVLYCAFIVISVSPIVTFVVFAVQVVREARGLLVAEWVGEGGGYRDRGRCRVTIHASYGERGAVVRRVDGASLLLVWRPKIWRRVRELRILAEPDEKLLSELRVACEGRRQEAEPKETDA